MKLMLAASLFLFGLTGMASAGSCDDDSIWTVSNDGSIITTNVGAVFQVDDEDLLKTEQWVAGQSVLVCGDHEIINTDENGERAGVERLK